MRFRKSLSTWQTITLGLLADGPKNYSELRSILKADFDWSASKAALYSQTRKLVIAGYVLREGDTFSLTRHGFEAWSEAMNFFRDLTARWAERQARVRRGDLPEGRRARRPVAKEQRLPTPSEQVAILQHGPPTFVDLYEAWLVSGVKPTDIATAEISGVDFRARRMRLAKTAVSGRQIEVRDVPIDDRLRPVLKRSIGERKSGPVFLTPTGRRWTEARLSKTFREICRKAGLPDGIVLMGRGGTAK